MKESFERFLLELIFENSKHQDAVLKHKLKFEDSGFLEALKYLSSWMKIAVSVYVSPNYISFIDCQ